MRPPCLRFPLNLARPLPARLLPASLLPATLAAVVLSVTAAAADPPAAPGLDPAPVTEAPPEPTYLVPIKTYGEVPPIVAPDVLPAPESADAQRILQKRYTRELRAVRRRFLSARPGTDAHDEGLRRLREFVDPVAFAPMMDVLAHEDDTVRSAVLDFIAERGADGQVALARAIIYGDDPIWQHAALDRLERPAPPPVLGVLDRALRSNVHQIANNAGALSGALGAMETIPLLIFGQATGDPVGEGNEGDLAWIAFQTQHAFVSGLVPITGDNSGAFLPVMSTVSDGTVLRVMDAVAIVYRTYIHTSLVDLTSRNFGESTEHMGYDMERWMTWYNQDYVPHENRRRREAWLAAGGGE